MLCVTIESGASHWQIFQRRKSGARVRLAGAYRIHPSCEHCALYSARVLIRVMSEADNSAVVPWTPAQACGADDETLRAGTWRAELLLPAGGLYRIETALDAKSGSPEASRMFGGEMRLHLGVGDVFVIAGQSNAAGFGMDAAPDPPDLRVHLFRNRCEWDLAAHPMNESSGAPDALNAEIGCCGTSPWLSFAKAYADASGCPVGLVQTAMGGQSVDRWDEKVNGDLMRHLLRRVRLAGGKAAGVLWIQGCTDAVPGKAERYGGQFARAAARLRRALGAPVFTVQINRYLKPDGDDASWGELREAQRRTARVIPGVYAVPSTDLALSDYIHSSSSANLRLGRRMASQCAAVLLGKGSFAAPDIEAARTAGQDAMLEFSGAPQGFVIAGEDAARRSFTVSDAAGEIGIESVSEASAPGSIRLRLVRSPGDGACVSFAWRCDPPAVSLLDAVTRMPPLSFYRVPLCAE